MFGRGVKTLRLNLDREWGKRRLDRLMVSGWRVVSQVKSRSWFGWTTLVLTREEGTGSLPMFESSKPWKPEVKD